MLGKNIKSLVAAAILVGSVGVASAADINIRATANSNENDEDYDGLIVFKNYVEAAQIVVATSGGTWQQRILSPVRSR